MKINTFQYYYYSVFLYFDIDWYCMSKLDTMTLIYQKNEN